MQVEVGDCITITGIPVTARLREAELNTRLRRWNVPGYIKLEQPTVAFAGAIAAGIDPMKPPGIIRGGSLDEHCVGNRRDHD